MSTFRVAKQHGKRGYFAEVTISVTRADSPGLHLDYRAEERRWLAGVGFGIAYAFEKCGGNALSLPGTLVRVEAFSGHEVDTKEIVAAYVAACAYFESVSAIIPDGIGFDPATGVFSFAK